LVHHKIFFFNLEIQIINKMNFQIGDNVYAKVFTYGYWPSKILEYNDAQKFYKLMFYGDHTM